MKVTLMKLEYEITLQIIRFNEAVHDAIVNNPNFNHQVQADVNNQFKLLAKLGDVMKRSLKEAEGMEPGTTATNLSTIKCPICGALCNGRVAAGDQVAVPKHKRGEEGKAMELIADTASACPGSGYQTRSFNV